MSDSRISEILYDYKQFFIHEHNLYVNTINTPILNSFMMILSFSIISRIFLIWVRKIYILEGLIEKILSFFLPFSPFLLGFIGKNDQNLGDGVGSN